MEYEIELYEKVDNEAPVFDFIVSLLIFTKVLAHDIITT
jgi:hypothetical protein